MQRVRTVPIPVGFNLRAAITPGVDAARWLAAERPDVLHIHHPFPLSTAAARLGRSRGIPVVATNHTVPACTLWGIRGTPLYRPAGRAFGWWIKTVLESCTAVTTPTASAAREVRDLGYAGDIEVISNGVDILRFSPGSPDRGLRVALSLDERPVVLYTGRLDAEKDMPTWLRAAAASRLDVQFLVGGKGTDRAACESLAQDLGLADRVRFLGYLSDEEYPGLYRLADLYFITGPVELQSITTLEAVASGLPVVAVRGGALPELVQHGENGLLAAPGDVQTLASHLRSLVTDNEMRVRMGRASREIAKGHDIGRTIEAYEGLFAAVIARSQRASAGRVLAGRSGRMCRG